MTHKAQQIAIAKLCGWVKHPANPDNPISQPERWENNDGSIAYHWTNLPNYPGNLNAMRDAKKFLRTQEEKNAFLDNLLVAILGETAQQDGSYLEIWELSNATASQESEAFLKTFGRWQENN